MLRPAGVGEDGVHAVVDQALDQDVGPGHRGFRRFGHRPVPFERMKRPPRRRSAESAGRWEREIITTAPAADEPNRPVTVLIPWGRRVKIPPGWAARPFALSARPRAARINPHLRPVSPASSRMRLRRIRRWWPALAVVPAAPYRLRPVAGPVHVHDQPGDDICHRAARRRGFVDYQAAVNDRLARGSRPRRQRQRAHLAGPRPAPRGGHHREPSAAAPHQGRASTSSVGTSTSAHLKDPPDHVLD